MFGLISDSKIRCHSMTMVLSRDRLCFQQKKRDPKDRRQCEHSCPAKDQTRQLLMVEQADDAVDEFEGTVQYDGATDAVERVRSLLPRKAR